MNEHVGFLNCPECKCTWHDGQFACSYCGSMTPPDAIRPYGPPWAWYLAAGVLGFLWLVDRNFGGHVWRGIAHLFRVSN